MSTDHDADRDHVDVMAAWITKSLRDEAGRPVPLADAASGLGYLDAMFQTAVLLKGGEFWDLVARRLVDAGVLDPTKHGRYTSGLTNPEQ